MSSRISALLVPVLGGAALLAAGFAAGRVALPAGRVGDLPARAAFVEAFRQAARGQGVTLAPGAPRVRLGTGEGENRAARRLLGEDAEDWIVRQGRGLEVGVSQAARWGTVQGRLSITFTANRKPWVVEWSPTTLSGFFSSQGSQPDGICNLLLGPGERLGNRGPSAGTQQGVETVTPVVGSSEPASLYRVDPNGGTLLCSRRPGTVEAAAADVEAHAWVSSWPTWIAPSSLVVSVVLLFVILAFRARIDLWNAILFAGAFLVTALAGDWPTTPPLALVQGVATPVTALWLLLLWAAAESWARTNLPDFTTTLDTLRRGRLGARAGRELLVGWSAGAALAGARVALLAGAAVLPGIAPAGAAASVPLFALGAHPLRRAMVWVGVLLLLLTLGRKLLPRGAIPFTLLLAPLFATPLPLSPWLTRYGAGLLLSAPLLLLLRRAGLTAALVAALLAHLLPTAALALRYPDWLPVTAVVATAVALAPLVAGVIGVARGEAVEHDPGAVPEFVRREERERRLSYEMDLLARMQLGLLPQGLPRLAGYEVTARSILATEAGGDLYDFMRDERGRIWIAAGDVSGHGYSCAIGQASVKASLLSLVDGHVTPARILERVDRVLRGSNFGTRQFATLCLVCLEEASGRMLVSNAGHPFPLLAAPQQPAREIELPGLPLGQGPPRRYHDVEVVIPRGGVLLLYSDGLYEATDPAGTPYGFERPRRVLTEAAAWNAAEVLERLIFDWRRHLAGSAAADDTTLVVLKRQ